MWLNFIRTSGRSFLLYSPQVAQRIGNKHRKLLHCSTDLGHVQTLCAAPAVSESDPEYIVPYKSEYENSHGAKNLIQALKTKILLNKEEINCVLSNKAVLKSCREKSLTEVLNLLHLEGVKKDKFVEYPWLLTLDKKKLLQKLSLFKSLNGFRDINDFVPFLRLNLPRVRSLVSFLNRESKDIDHGNRVYFVAEKLNLPPAIVTKYLANRLFVLEMPLEMFKTNLQHMLNYNVEPMSILKDLWGFRYSPASVELRLKRATQAKKDKIMPWMVRCPEPILQKSLQLSLDELKVLNDKASVAEYVGERLGFSTEEAQAIMNRHPQVKSVRVTKIKEVLDYLLDEEKFTRYEIAQVPRILCHSLETTKERIEELKQYGCRPSSLVIVCRSKKEYEKFLEQWQKNSKCDEIKEHMLQEKDKQINN